MTAQEAQELFKSVDDIFEFASQDSGLAIKRKVKKELTSRDDVEKYVSGKMKDDEDRKRFERAELVLKKFGLIPKDFKLQDFMVKLLREQVAGYYDSRRKTVHLLDWIRPETQKPVMAHELTHALQDQAIGLDEWIKEARKQIHKQMDELNADAEIDEQVAARNALVEGQGMIVMVDYLLQSMHMDVVKSPAVVKMMEDAMAKDDSSPVLKTAPLLLKEALVFPYRDGMQFVYEVLKEGGKEKAFASALTDPPVSTRQIMFPTSYLEHEKIEPLRIPDLKSALGEDFKRYDTGSLGQFDIAILAKQFGGEKDVERLAPEWRGGMYYSAARKSADKDHLSTGDLVLVYYSRWGSAEAARAFGDFYATALKQRYAKVEPQQDQLMTDEGPVRIEAKGEYLLICEGLNVEQVEAVKKRLAEPQTKSQAASGDLGLTWAAPVYALVHPSWAPDGKRPTRNH